MPQSTQISVRMLLLLFLVPMLALAQNSSTVTIAQATPVRIAWEGKPKISRYRLQLASNEQFSDIVFDKVVQGREYKVSEVPPGKYFWRVAPSASETGSFSKPLPVVIPPLGAAEPIERPKPTVMSPPNDVGWSTATGVVDEPVAARLRAGSSLDLVGVNSYGMVYAINGENGVSLWSSRYRPSAKKGEPTNSDGAPVFAPLLIEQKDKAAIVVVAFDGGLRALDGATGRELWRVALSGEAVVGALMNPETDGSGTVAVFDNAHTLSFFKGTTGQVISQTKLDGTMVGHPAPLNVKNERALLMAFNNGMLDARNMAGVSVLAVKIDSVITSSPQIVRSPRGPLVMLGTEAGLVALGAADLTPLWRVATEADAPQGIFTSVDLDADGTDEVVVVTRRGRVVAVNVGTGKIKWFSEGATDGTRPAFADLNSDRVSDVLVAGGSAFALGFSGKDGALIWKADESAVRSAENRTSPRVLVAAQFGSGGQPLLIGTDSARTGLRAVGLPAGALK